MVVENSAITGIERRDANLVSWEPGQSGNPSGRPAGSRGFAALVRERTKSGEDVVDFLISVMKGSVITRLAGHADDCKHCEAEQHIKLSDRIAAADRLLDRGFGKVIQDIALSAPDGGPLQTESLHVFAQMSVEELKELYQAGRRDLEHDLSPTEESLEEATPDPEGTI